MKKNLIYFLLPVGIILGWLVCRFWWCPNAPCPSCDSELPCKTAITQNDIIYNGIDPSVYTGDTTINTADIAVDSVLFDTTNNLLTGKIRCTKSANNTAWGVKAMVFLPAEVYIKSFSSSDPSVKACLYHGKLPNGGGDSRIKSGYIAFTKDSMDKGHSFDFSVTIARPTDPTKFSKGSQSFNIGIFAYNQSPDPILCNNYWYWRESAYCDSAYVTLKPSKNP